MIVNEIYISHRLTFPIGMKNEAYKDGRLFSGIVFALSGSIDYIFYLADGKREVVHFKSGQMMYLPELSGYETINSEETFEHYTINFGLIPNLNQAQSSSAQKDMSMTDDKVVQAFFGKSPIVITPDSFADTEKLFERAVSFARKAGFDKELMCRAVVYELLHIFAKKISEHDKFGNVGHSVMLGKKYIDENFCENFTVDYLSQLCAVSKTHFRRKFHEAFGISPSDYRQALRLERAKELLLTRLYRVSEVSELCGYNDANYFARIFKLKIGVSPQEFMNSR